MRDSSVIQLLSDVRQRILNETESLPDAKRRTVPHGFKNHIQLADGTPFDDNGRPDFSVFRNGVQNSRVVPFFFRYRHQTFNIFELASHHAFFSVLSGGDARRVRISSYQFEWLERMF